MRTVILIVILLFASAAYAMDTEMLIMNFFGNPVTTGYLMFGTDKVTLGGQYVVVRER